MYFPKLFCLLNSYIDLALLAKILEQMIAFARLIQDVGFTEIFANRVYKVLIIGGMKYWTMDFPLENTDLINRTYADNSLKEQIAKYVLSPDFKFENSFCGTVAGVDEAGRGPWVGPVVAGAVIFLTQDVDSYLLKYLNDSKKLRK